MTKQQLKKKLGYAKARLASLNTLIIYHPNPFNTTIEVLRDKTKSDIAYYETLIEELSND